MISIENYQDFLSKIKSLDENVQVKLIGILDKRLEGILPKEYMFSHQQMNKYDYTYGLNENLIPFLDIFNKYFYSSKLIDDKIYDQKISYHFSELCCIYEKCKNLDNNSFKNINETIIFFGNIGVFLYKIYKKIENILLRNKKDILINILLKYFKNIDINIINSIFENSIDINDFFSSIEYKLNENIETTKKISIIKWYIFSHEMKFLDKINFFEYEIQNIIENLSKIYENEKNKLNNEIILEEYTNNFKKMRIS